MKHPKTGTDLNLGCVIQSMTLVSDEGYQQPIEVAHHHKFSVLTFGPYSMVFTTKQRRIHEITIFDRTEDPPEELEVLTGVWDRFETKEG